jgi:hypothetical protein
VPIHDALHYASPIIDTNINGAAAVDRLSSLLDWRDVLARASSFCWKIFAPNLPERSTVPAKVTGAIVIVLDDEACIELRLDDVLRLIFMGDAPLERALRGNFEHGSGGGSKGLDDGSISKADVNEVAGVVSALRKLVDARTEVELCWRFLDGDLGDARKGVDGRSSTTWHALMARLLETYRDAADALIREVVASCGDEEIRSSRRPPASTEHATDACVRHSDSEVTDVQLPTDAELSNGAHGTDVQRREVQELQSPAEPESAVGGRRGQRPGRNRGRNRERQRRQGTSREDWIRRVAWQ